MLFKINKNLRENQNHYFLTYLVFSEKLLKIKNNKMKLINK